MTSPSPVVPLTSEQRQMVEDNIKLAYSAAHRLIRHTPLEFEDLLGVCMFGLSKAALNYDPNKGVQFSTFATRVMQNEVFMANRKERKNVSAIYLEELMDAETGLQWESLMSVDQRLIDDAVATSIDINKALTSLIPKLKERDRILISLLIQNPELTQKELSEFVGVRRSQVSRDIMRIREEIQRRIAV